MSNVLILGAGGFIGSHLARRLKSDGFYVRAVDIREPAFSPSAADEFLKGDLRDPAFCKSVFQERYERVYQLAADMGGAGYIFSGVHDASIMSNSVQVNLNVLQAARDSQPGLIFFSSSACVYPDPFSFGPGIYAESTAYPAQPDSDYGWEKLFSERLYQAYARNFGLRVRIARLHNIFGPEADWSGGREKAIAAICRKVIMAGNGEAIEIWGDGAQTRSFLYIDECLEGIQRLMSSPYSGPLNIGSEEMICINDLTKMIIDISGKELFIRHIAGPLGVSVRTSHNALISEKLGWAPEYLLRKGVEKTYRWIESRILESL